MKSERIDKMIEHLYRLDNIKQWSEKNTLFTESVASHSYKVSFFTAVVFYSLFRSVINSSEVAIFYMKCMNRALMHDWDESIILRDLSHELKYNEFNGGELRERVDEYVEHVINTDFTIFMDLYPFFHDSMLSDHKDVNSLVKIADWLAMYCFLKREFLLGNRTLGECNDTVMRGLVESVGVFKREIRNGMLSAMMVDSIDYTFLDNLTQIEKIM